MTLTAPPILLPLLPVPLLEDRKPSLQNSLSPLCLKSLSSSPFMKPYHESHTVSYKSIILYLTFP